MHTKFQLVQIIKICLDDIFISIKLHMSLSMNLPYSHTHKFYDIFTLFDRDLLPNISCLIMSHLIAAIGLN